MKHTGLWLAGLAISILCAGCMTQRTTITPAPPKQAAHNVDTGERVSFVFSGNDLNKPIVTKTEDGNKPFVTQTDDGKKPPPPCPICNKTSCNKKKHTFCRIHNLYDCKEEDGPCPICNQTNCTESDHGRTPRHPDPPILYQDWLKEQPASQPED